MIRGPVHRVRDLTVDVALEGGFDAAFVAGDNALVATDTMKNTVYAFATEHLNGAIEPFARRLATHFVEQGGRAGDGVDPGARVGAAADQGRSSPRRVPRTGGMTRTAVAVADPDGAVVDSGVEDLVVMKTGRSAFSGFPRDASRPARGP